MLRLRQCYPARRALRNKPWGTIYPEAAVGPPFVFLGRCSFNPPSNTHGMNPVLPRIAKTTSANPNPAPCSPCGGGSSPALLARLWSCILCVLSCAALSKCGA